MPPAKTKSLKRCSVFLSYAHESNEHKEKVYGLAASLRRDGFEILIDIEKKSQEDWPLWMQRQLKSADFILCICTKVYLERFDHESPANIGLGVGWEGGLIRRMLYAENQQIDQIFPVCFSSDDEQFIPITIDGNNRFTVCNDVAYKQLLRKLLGKPEYQLPEEAIVAPPLTIESTIVAPLFIRPDNSEIDPKIRPADQSVAIKNDHASEITESSPIKHGKYVILKSLPSGLISSLEIADDKQLDRKVVIKSLVRPEDEMHFKAEVRELSRVGKHPNIVSVYGAWLDDKDPHYVREYIEGQSLHHKLRSDGKANLTIDFDHQVLITIGDAMIFAMQKNVFDLGLEPEKVLVRANDLNSNSGLVSNYGIVVSPGSGGSEYVKHELPQRLSRERQFYVPPEYFHDNLTSVNPHRANQYRLGILGYEMLVGSKDFFDIAGRQKDPSSGEINWPPLKSVDNTERFPRFLRDAIDRMIKRDPKDRYPTLEDAVEAVARRDVLVEVARDSFRRIIDKDDSTRFFHEFYTQLLKNKNIKKIFDSAGFPSNKKNVIDSQKNWVRQYGLLKEAIVLLFAHSLLKETDEPTVLSRICETHAKFMSIEYYDEFREKLLESVVKFDKGTDPRKLESAWRQAIEPGLSYLKSRFSSAQQESESGRDGGRLDGYEKVRAESRQQGVLLGRIAVLQELLGVDRTSSDELSEFDDERLSEIANELQSQLPNRR